MANISDHYSEGRRWDERWQMWVYQEDEERAAEELAREERERLENDAMTEHFRKHPHG